LPGASNPGKTKKILLKGGMKKCTKDQYREKMLLFTTSGLAAAGLERRLNPLGSTGGIAPFLTVMSALSMTEKHVLLIVPVFSR